MYLSIGDGPFLTDLQSRHFLYDVGYRVVLFLLKAVHEVCGCVATL